MPLRIAKIFLAVVLSFTFTFSLWKIIICFHQKYFSEVAEVNFWLEDNGLGQYKTLFGELGKQIASHQSKHHTFQLRLYPWHKYISAYLQLVGWRSVVGIFMSYVKEMLIKNKLNVNVQVSRNLAKFYMIVFLSAESSYLFSKQRQENSAKNGTELRQHRINYLLECNFKPVPIKSPMAQFIITKIVQFPYIRGRNFRAKFKSQNVINNNNNNFWKTQLRVSEKFSLFRLFIGKVLSNRYENIKSWCFNGTHPLRE